MSTDVHKSGPLRGALVPALVSLAAAFGVAALGGMATASSVETWYATLQKPAFNPPNGIFAPVWTTLYALMAIAAWRVWQASSGPVRRRAIGLYAAQLVLNLGWSWLFFGLRQPGLALAEIAVLLVAVVLTGLTFWRIDRPAGLMFVPYAAWVAFASLLNFEIWRLN